MSQQTEDHLAAIDVRHLHEFDWPITRLLARPFVERLELQRYKRQLLASGRWERIRAVPHRDGSGEVSPHVFDLYGVPASDHAGGANASRIGGAGRARFESAMPHLVPSGSELALHWSECQVSLI